MSMYYEFKVTDNYRALDIIIHEKRMVDNGKGNVYS